MITAWFTHLETEKEQEQFKKTVESSKPVLDRLNTMIDRELTGLEDSETNPKFYDTPNWDYKQAYSNGFKAGLKMVKTITTLDHKETTNAKSVRPRQQ